MPPRHATGDYLRGALWGGPEAASGGWQETRPEGPCPKAGCEPPARSPSKRVCLVCTPRLCQAVGSALQKALAFSVDFPLAAPPDHSLPRPPRGPFPLRLLNDLCCRQT